MEVFSGKVGETLEQTAFFVAAKLAWSFLFFFFRDVGGVKGAPLVGKMFVEELLELISFGKSDLHSFENVHNLKSHINFR